MVNGLEVFREQHRDFADRYTRIPGHEVIGTISKCGSDISGWQAGQRVDVRATR